MASQSRPRVVLCLAVMLTGCAAYSASPAYPTYGYDYRAGTPFYGGTYSASAAGSGTGITGITMDGMAEAGMLVAGTTSAPAGTVMQGTVTAGITAAGVTGISVVGPP